jgi:XTP/dITP diphosphohydrolase
MPNFIPPQTATDPSSGFLRLLNVLNTLRAECPWDKKQTMETLRHLTIEETYELSDAIMEGDVQEVKKELGDVMMHLVFYSRIAEEQGQFDILDVLNGVCDKLVNRHPHIYSDTVVQNEEDVKRNWEQIKLKEGNKSVLGGVPASLPALVKAARIQEKARGIGFDWEHKEQVWEKVEEELQEFKEEFNVVENSAIDVEKAEVEFGDLLFSLINYARFININPENALEKTNRKFIKRFQHLENRAKENGKALQDMTLAEMDVYWNEAKQL